MIPDYIREHILHALPPSGCYVPDGSLPAVAEGRFYRARVATVGINPRGAWMRGDYFPEERQTLDAADLDEGFLNRVWEEKTLYFERNRYMYFTSLEPILNDCGDTYGGMYEAVQPNLACSLDLVQWPTDPLWSGLPKEGYAQSKLLDDGVPFFKRLLQEHENIELLLGNGKTVVERLERTFRVRFRKWQAVDLGTYIYCGEWSRLFEPNRSQVECRSKMLWQ